MRFGVCLPAQLPPDADFAASMGRIVDFARAARDLGYDLVMAGDHRLTVPYITATPVPLLARVAAETGNMRLLAMALLPLHHPVHVAEDMATLDAISHGRLIVGAALGYRDLEYEALGVERAQRVPRMLESLTVLEQMWRHGHVEFDGEHYRIPRTPVHTRPVQKNGVPIWVAANSDAAVERVANLGYPWLMNPHADVETLRRQAERYRIALKANGQGPPQDIPIMREVYVSRDGGHAQEIMQGVLREKYRTYVDWGQDKAIGPEETFRRPIRELAEDRFIVGTPEECIAQIQRLEDVLKVNWLVFRGHWPGMPLSLAEDSLELFAQEVMPAFAVSHAATSPPEIG